MFQAPHYPIVYIRGYAMTQSAVEDTVADPYMGFNVGATKIRQLHTSDVARHIFESPLVRLMKDEGYKDVFDAGAELPQSQVPPARSVWIYRYYEPVSNQLGKGFRPEILDYAKGLKRLLGDMQTQYATRDGKVDPTVAKQFKVHLVAHSMGGLIARCFLQNVSRADPRVDKVFTYATPHGGIDLRWIGNVPDFLRFNNSENFNEETMREYLRLPKGRPVSSLDGHFPAARFFCLVGTNHRDYGAAKNLVGPMSDGLVQIANACVDGSPRAFVHRSHSGHYGIVNSEEGYQNLRRFLFGDARIDAYLRVDDLPLPAAVEKLRKDGKEVRASYHIEVIARVRGVRWDLHRRTVNEESAIFAQFDDLMPAADGTHRRVHLASSFLSSAGRVNKRRLSLGYSLDLGVMVPEYVVDGLWFNKNHFEGGYLFRDKINLEATVANGGGWTLRYGFDSSTPNRATRLAEHQALPGHCHRFTIPVEQKTKPGLRGELIIETQPWS